MQMSFRNFHHFFLRDSRGVSAIEFAFIAPVMITMYLGCVELSRGLAFDGKITQSARALSDLVAQSSLIDKDKDLPIIFAAANQVLYPYNTVNGQETQVRMVVTSVKIDAAKKITIPWSAVRTGTKPTGTAHQVADMEALIPEASRIPNTSLIVSEVSYGYDPLFFHGVISNISMKETALNTPRAVSIVCQKDQTPTQCSM